MNNYNDILDEICLNLKLEDIDYNIQESDLDYEQISLLNKTTDRLTTIEEAYIGKTKEILEIENYFDLFKRSYDPKKDYRFNKDYKNLCKSFEKAFGFEGFYLMVVPDVNTLNAGTIPYSLRADYIINPNKLKNYVEISPNGYFKLKEENGFICFAVIYAGLLMEDTFTAKEITAIFLHEIGHNFSDIISGKIKFANANTLMLPFYISLFTIISAITNPIDKYGNYNKYENSKEIIKRFLEGTYRIINVNDNNIKDIFDRNKKEKKNDKMAQKNYEEYNKPGSIYDVIKDLITILFNAYIFSLKVLKKYAYKSYEIFTIGAKAIFGHIRKTDEIIADKFTYLYGYGQELASALTKLSSMNEKHESDVTKIIKKVPIIGNLFNLGRIGVSMLDTLIFDEHPFTIQRVNSILNSLEIEASKTTNPKIKKSLEENIKEINKIKEEYLKINPTGSPTEKEKEIFNNIINKISPYGYISKNKDSKIDYKFDKTIEDYQNK